ncbi:MAG: serine/threonine protein kinase, partial [Akkermansia sp.]|nr:serine/threonine protein kinase [Akkermansia sp.]
AVVSPPGEAVAVPAEEDEVSTLLGLGKAPVGAVVSPQGEAVAVPAEEDEVSTLLGLGKAPVGAVVSPPGEAVAVPAGEDEVSSLLPREACPVDMDRPICSQSVDATKPEPSGEKAAVATDESPRPEGFSVLPAADAQPLPSGSGMPAYVPSRHGLESMPVVPASVLLRQETGLEELADEQFLPDGTLLNRGTYRIILEVRDDERKPDGSPRKKPIGQGGFGITYLAEDVKLNRKVIIKENFPKDFVVRLRNLNVVSRKQGRPDDPYGTLRDNFLKEAKIIAAVKERHPNIVDVVTFFEDFNTSYFVMPYIEGESLRKCLEGRGWDEASARELLEGLLGGVAYLHELGVLHLDIKPDNILMNKGIVPVLIDFGASLSTLLPNGAMAFSAGYAPPEQCAYERLSELGPWTDLYALGATMHHIITGTRPNPQSRPLSEQVKSYPGFSRAFLASIDKAMHPEIRHRWQSAREWLELYQQMDEITRESKRLI